jgi:hypothetical protein
MWMIGIGYLQDVIKDLYRTVMYIHHHAKMGNTPSPTKWSLPIFGKVQEADRQRLDIKSPGWKSGCTLMIGKHVSANCHILLIQQ